MNKTDIWKSKNLEPFFYCSSDSYYWSHRNILLKTENQKYQKKIGQRTFYKKIRSWFIVLFFWRNFEISSKIHLELIGLFFYWCKFIFCIFSLFFKRERRRWSELRCFRCISIFRFCFCQNLIKVLESIRFFFSRTVHLLGHFLIQNKCILKMHLLNNKTFYSANQKWSCFFQKKKNCSTMSHTFEFL